MAVVCHICSNKKHCKCLWLNTATGHTVNYNIYSALKKWQCCSLRKEQLVPPVTRSALYRKCSNVIPWDYPHITGLPNSSWQTQSEFSESEDTWDFISEIIWVDNSGTTSLCQLLQRTLGAKEVRTEAKRNWLIASVCIPLIQRHPFLVF